ncbi:MAG: neutral zinc metallopeptidase, partial [Nitrospirota bacterium]|nr:neutral zinc metallopeptidase [Nitrospirota bacterium]
MRWSRSMMFFALGLILIWTVPSHGETFLPASHPKVKASRDVYERLIRTIGDARMPPDLRLVAGKASTFDVALYVPSRRAIYLEEEFYDLLQSTLSSNHSQGLALILGHELAHFYRNHTWVEDFNRSFAQRQIMAPGSGPAPARSSSGENATERRRLEAEADYFAGFYGYLAGLPTVTVASQLFDSVYEHYHFDPALPAYEHLRQRKETAREAQQKLQALIPLFETGVQSLLIQDYGSAGRIFDRVATEFPSPEVLSNTAVADSLAALQWESQTERRYVYPIELDPDTRLTGEATRGPADLTPEERAERR